MLPKMICNDWSLKNKAVFLRVDLNIESLEETVKFNKIIPTLQWLHDAGARTIIGTHRGRPHGYDAWLSTEQLATLFQNANFPIAFCPGVHDLPQMAHQLQPGSFLLLENLRFFQEPEHLISLLQETCEFYINDSWGSAHRGDPFVDQLASEFEPSKRSIGPLVEKELHHLAPLKQVPAQKLTVLIGGAKYAEKLAAIEALSSRAGHILVGPAQSFPFHCARNENTAYFASLGLFSPEIVAQARIIIKRVEQPKINMTIPKDYAIEMTGESRSLPIGQLSTDQKIIGLGTQSVEAFVKIIQQSHTALYAGLMGFLDNEHSMNINKLIFDALAHVQGTTIIAGGQTAQAAYDLGYENRFTWISTGGGATLAYICNKTMPGLELF